MRQMMQILVMAALGLAIPTGVSAFDKKPHLLTSKGESLLLDGKQFIIRSGEIHYPRVPRAYWKDRLQKARAMGLNTICTYLFWNLHEPEEGRFDFSDNLDVVEYLREAQQEGLWVIVLPGSGEHRICESAAPTAASYRPPNIIFNAWAGSFFHCNRPKAVRS